MARIKLNVFDPTLPLYARRAFVAAGRHYGAGDHFDWKRLSVAQRKASALFNSGHVGHDQKTSVDNTVAAKETATTKVEPSVEEVIDPSTLDNLAELRDLAREEGADIKNSKVSQRAAILAKRKENKEPE